MTKYTCSRSPSPKTDKIWRHEACWPAKIRYVKTGPASSTVMTKFERLIINLIDQRTMFIMMKIVF